MKFVRIGNESLYKDIVYLLLYPSGFSGSEERIDEKRRTKASYVPGFYKGEKSSATALDWSAYTDQPGGGPIKH